MSLPVSTRQRRGDPRMKGPWIAISFQPNLCLCCTKASSAQHHNIIPVWDLESGATRILCSCSQRPTTFNSAAFSSCAAWSSMFLDYVVSYILLYVRPSQIALALRRGIYIYTACTHFLGHAAARHSVTAAKPTPTASSAAAAAAATRDGEIALLRAVHQSPRGNCCPRLSVWCSGSDQPQVLVWTAERPRRP